MLIELDPAGIPDVPGAACRDIETPEIFFAFEEHCIEQAREVCRRCPGIRACLAWALAHKEHGVWAATTEEQRTELLDRHRKEAS
ncbi:WhiB family transcriptional regulator [Nocardioides lijunqiniae]|uniref:WhiB family transcriptional regulator n=1 Tax=Nocardioides lijunqiniae TaxID=2760832 RepID=UPI0018781837|nr:WhiB family transcriptional regulator [Nocardioides lijunqiniae]